MQRINVRGADGQRAILALVRRTERTTYVCPLARYRDVRDGDEEPVVGFPNEDVEILN